MKRKAFVPTKGGDGGVAVPRRRGPHWTDNGKVVLTGEQIPRAHRAAFEAGLVRTTDPCDRAHLHREPLANIPRQLDEAWVLAEPGLLESRFGAGKLPGQLRRYHRSQMTSRGVAYDSMFDGAAATAARLQGELDIDLGWRTQFPRPERRQYAPTEVQRARALAGLTCLQARAVTQQSTRQSALTTAEIELEKAATRLIRDSCLKE